MQTNLRTFYKLLASLLLIAALFSSGLNLTVAQAAALSSTTCTGSGTVTCNLWTNTATIALPGTASVKIWGYTDTAAGVLTTPGGPTLIVNQGDVVTVILHNSLPEASSLLFQGQAMIPDETGVTAGNSKSYTFTATNAGTYLYEAGLTPSVQHQVAMGLYGALIVRPATANQAYASITSAYNDEALVLLSEIDTLLNNSANPANFDMRNYHPRYWLINGKPFPNTDVINTAVGNKLLLRFVNAGLQVHSMSLLGLNQNVIATDGSPLANAFTYVADSIAPGQTLDTITTIPAATTAGSRFALYDASLVQHNNNGAGFGGMLTFIQAGTSTVTGVDTTGPATGAVSLNPNPSTGSANVTINASISDANTGNNNVTAAEFFVDATGGNGSGLAMGGTFGSPTASVNAIITVAQLSSLTSGSHTIYVHGVDSLGNWGTFNIVTLVLDRTGPITSALVLSPGATNGSVDVSISANGNDTSTGNANVTAAEYFIDPVGRPANGSGTAMSVNIPAPIASLSTTIPAAAVNALSVGAHTISVRSMDVFGNWGVLVTSTLTVDKTGPATSGVSVSPSPNNGTTPFNTSTPAVRVSASFLDTSTSISAAEGFIDTISANGTGFVFVANDGVFNSLGEPGYGDIPIAVVGTLTQGSHTIFVHAKDAAGNWGTTSTTTLVIDKTAPTFTGVTLSPNPTNGAATVTLTVNGAVDTGGAGLAGGEYWVNPPTSTSPAPGSGTQFAGTSTNIAVGTFATGSYTVSVRLKDAASNWSTIRTAPLTVVPDAIFSNGFETGTSPWGWSSASTNTATRLNVTAAAALASSALGLQAQGNNTNYVQYNFGTAAQPATGTFDARFYFNPNNNASNGQDIFAGATSTAFSTQLFHVRYRRNGAQPQIQIQVGATANGTWVNITNNASNRIEVVWQSGTSLQLYINGVLSQTVTTAATGSIAAVRLGSVTSGGSSTLEFFDAFASKRAVSPLVGP